MNCKFKFFKYLGILAFFAIIMANYFCLYDKVVDEFIVNNGREHQISKLKRSKYQPTEKNIINNGTVN